MGGWVCFHCRRSNQKSHRSETIKRSLPTIVTDRIHVWHIDQHVWLISTVKIQVYPMVSHHTRILWVHNPTRQLFSFKDLPKRDRSASKSFSKVFQSSGSCPTGWHPAGDNFSRYPTYVPLPLEKPSDWTRPWTNDECTVDGSEIRRSPVEVGTLSHYLQGFKNIPGGCLGFLNHQQ